MLTAISQVPGSQISAAIPIMQAPSTQSTSRKIG